VFPEISNDIKMAIAKLVPLSENGNDPIIRVTIRKVALNGETILPDTLAFNQLEGIVAIGTSSGADGRTFPAKIHAKAADTIVPEGYLTIPPSLEHFYAAMVDGFARNVAMALL
jgi:hypothetical protein